MGLFGKEITGGLSCNFALQKDNHPLWCFAAIFAALHKQHKNQDVNVPL
jgi:hypothetical protein